MRFLLPLLILISACSSIPKPMQDAAPLRVVVAVGEVLASVASQPSIAAGAPMLEIREFDMPTAKGLSKKLTELDGKGHDTIYIKINSYGGSIHWGMEIIQRLESMKTPITCIVDWKAYSMGAFLLESPACDTRLMTKRSTLLFHEALANETGGNAHELRDTADHLEAISQALIAGTAERLKISEAELTAKITHKNWTMSYKTALEIGAIDDTIAVSDLPKVTEFDRPSLFEMLMGS